MRKLLFGLFLSLVASATSAQWVFVGENTSRDKSYADPATKRRTGNVVRMWVLTDYSKPGVIDGKVSLSDRVYTQYDCAERTSQILQLAFFSGKMLSGELLGSDTKLRSRDFIAPGTMAEAQLNFACK